MTVLLLFMAGAASVVLIQFFLDRSSERAAHKFVQDCHGDLPPPSFFRGKKYTGAFLIALMGYYAAADRERERKERERKARESRPQLGTPINPLNESDCPECANGQAHEDCRSGWRHQLYEANGVDFENLPQWATPCPTQKCGGNCGACNSDHCGICGVSPKKGSCDLSRHAAFEHKFNTVPDAFHPELPRRVALQRLRERVASGEIWGVRTACNKCHNLGYVFDLTRMTISMCQKCEALDVEYKTWVGNS